MKDAKKLLEEIEICAADLNVIVTAYEPEVKELNLIDTFFVAAAALENAEAIIEQLECFDFDDAQEEFDDEDDDEEFAALLEQLKEEKENERLERIEKIANTSFIKVYGDYDA